MCLPGLSLVVSARFRWSCSISIHLSPRSVTAGVRPFSFVSQFCHWWCPPFSAGHSISIHLSPTSVTAGVQQFYSSPRSVTGGVHAASMQHFYSFVVCHCWCPPFSAGDAKFLFVRLPICLPCWWPPFSGGHAAFIFICPPGLSLVVSALFRCFYSFVSHFCHCWCPPFSVGHPAFLFICLPGLSLPLFSAGHAAFYSSPRSVTAGVRPYSFVSQACHWRCPPFSAGHVAFQFFCLPGLSLVCPCLLAMKHFYSFVSQVSSHLPFWSVTGGVRPCPLAMRHFYSCVSQVRYCW